MKDLETTTKDREQELEFSVLRGSVPCIPRRTEIATREHPVPAIWMRLLRRTATSNLVMSIAVLIVTHLAVPLWHAATAMMVGGIITVNLQQPSAAPTQFTPLHLYFMSPSGSDANDGLAPTVGGGHGPWATPDHAGLVCGDVILAQSGTYSPLSMFHTPTGCPSTSGGIDGIGGIQFVVLLCAGTSVAPASVGDCIINVTYNPSNFSGTGPGINVSGFGAGGGNASHWAISGWKVNGGCTAGVMDGSGATLTGATIAGTTLTFSSSSGNPVLANQVVLGAGVTFNTTIVSGSGTTWTITPSQTESTPETMTTGFGCGTQNRAYEWRSCHSAGGGMDTLVSYGAVINSIAEHSGQLWDVDNCGDVGTNVNGGDYMAVVGSIAHDSNQDGICLGAIDAVGLGKLDANAGTHVWVHGNFGINNKSPYCDARFDGEDFLIDTPTNNLFNGKIVFSNNIGTHATRACILSLDNQTTTDPIAVFWYNNTCYFNNSGITVEGDLGELEWDNGNVNAGSHWQITAKNNVVFANPASSPGGSLLYGSDYRNNVAPVGGGSLTNGATGSENVYHGTAGSCAGAQCDAGNNISSATSGTAIGTNFYQDPLFANVTDLNNNQLGPPNCAGVDTTVKCMGWNPDTSVLTSNTVIADLQASCSHCSGKGYQKPQGCVTSGLFFDDFPAWMKGVVGLTASSWSLSAVITKKYGLGIIPCGM